MRLLVRVAAAISSMRAPLRPLLANSAVATSSMPAMVRAGSLVRGDEKRSVALPATERVSGGSDAGSSDWTHLSCQSIKLIGKRHLGAALHHELTFSNHVHQFNAGQDALR